jgi:hypothetical protein
MNERVEIELFFGGVIAGMLLIGAEVASFAYSVVIGALTQPGQYITAAAGTTALAMPAFALLVLVIEAAHNLLIGLLFPEEFSIGFVFGNLVILLIIGFTLWSAMPSAVFGMVIAFVMTFAGFIIKSAEGNRRSNKRVRK